jgi:hypothetical protein
VVPTAEWPAIRLALSPCFPEAGFGASVRVGDCTAKQNHRTLGRLGNQRPANFKKASGGVQHIYQVEPSGQARRLLIFPELPPTSMCEHRDKKTWAFLATMASVCTKREKMLF